MNKRNKNIGIMMARAKENALRRLHDRIDELILAGQMCANVCYNLAQRDYIPADDARSMTQSYKAWDKAAKAIRESIPPKTPYPKLK